MEKATNVIGSDNNELSLENCYIPIVDISIFDKDTNASSMSAAVKEVLNASKNSGFFFLKPSTETQFLISDLIDNVRAFFALQLVEKQRLNNDETTWFSFGDIKLPGTGPGYRGFGSDVNFTHDTRESYNYGDKYVVFNKWPREELLPQGWRKYFEKYTKSLLFTSVILRRVIALALGQDMKIFDLPGYFEKSTWLVGMVHYSCDDSNPQKGIHGIRPHCDGGIFTLLVTDGQPGLQVCVDKIKPISERTWVDVPSAPPGHFTVNLGKNLEIFSNGIFKAALHRVVNTSGKERFSSPFFYDTNIDTVLKPFPECCTKFPAMYSPTTPAKLSLERLSANNEQFR